MLKGKISIQTENIFPIIKQFLYTDQEIFLRELISNAIDATSKLKTIHSKGEYSGSVDNKKIEIILDEDKKTLTIRDYGIGMDADEVKKYLNELAFSSAHDFLEKYKDDTNIIGHFGLGFYSAFMVSDLVEVKTKSYKEDSVGVTWKCKGDPEFSLEENDKKEIGTDIILHINEESSEYLKTYRIQELLDKYCKFLPVPIKFGTKKETISEGEGEDKKTSEIEVDNIINITEPAWKKSASSLSKEEYLDFYRELYPMSEDPLFWIHLNVDYPFNLTGILYFPKISNSMEVQKNKIQLYSNQVYVTDDVKEIVPEFLTLLHGVIDSPDIPLNVSRSSLQSDRNVKKITSYITKKVAGKLNDLFKKEREEFETKWDDINVFIKYGMLSDEKFNDKAIDFTLFKNMEDKYFTIEEYRDFVKENQTDKNDKIVFLYTNNKIDQSSYIKTCKENSYDVILLDNIMDNHFIQHLEAKVENIVFKRVDSETIDMLVEKDDTKESVLSEKEQEKVKSIFERIAKPNSGTLQLKPLSPNDSPVLLTKPEFMRRMTEMQVLQGMDAGIMGEMYNVIVNTNHPLISDKLIKMRKAEKVDSFAKHLVNLAKLNHNMLKGDELTEFVNESIKMLND